MEGVFSDNINDITELLHRVWASETYKLYSNKNGYGSKSQEREKTKWGTQTRILYGDKFTYMMHYFDDIRNGLGVGSQFGTFWPSYKSDWLSTLSVEWLDLKIFLI